MHVQGGRLETGVEMRDLEFEHFSPEIQTLILAPERSSFEMVRAGDHCDFKTSRQMLPLLLMFGW